MSKPKSLLLKKRILSPQDSQFSDEAFKLLKNAWSSMPEDFTIGERSLFIELAEKIIKSSDSSTNLN